MALLTTISSVNEVVTSYRPYFIENATLSNAAKIRVRTQKNIEYRGLTETAAINAADAIGDDISGVIFTDGSSTSPTLHVDGFENSAGTVWPGTSVVISGDDNVYYVESVAVIAANEVDLVLVEHFLEPGTILVSGGSQTGTELVIDGFTNYRGKVRKGTTFTISGDGTTYTVTAQAEIDANASTVTITPTLSAAPSDNTAVTLSHPGTDIAVELAAGGVDGSATRNGDSGAYTLSIEIDYFPEGNDWKDAS